MSSTDLDVRDDMLRRVVFLGRKILQKPEKDGGEVSSEDEGAGYFKRLRKCFVPSYVDR